VIDCKAEDRKHQIAEKYLAEHPVRTRVFLVLVARAPRTLPGRGTRIGGLDMNIPRVGAAHAAALALAIADRLSARGSLSAFEIGMISPVSGLSGRAERDTVDGEFDRPRDHSSAPSPSGPLVAADVIALQRTAGNRAVMRVLANGSARRLMRYRFFSRHLTDDEVAILRPVYGDQLDYDKVRINESSALAVDGVPRTTSNTINIPGTSLDRKTLIHEAGHVWQHQHGRSVIIPSLSAHYHAWRKTGSRNAAYDWHDQEANGVPYDQWNPEQQATYIEDNEALHP
jgi:hypothetical protein